MSELMYGGWLAENIYYLGAAGSVIVNGVRIAGVSGIYKKPIFPLGHFERVPYADHDGDIHSVCYLRLYEEQKLSLVSTTTAPTKRFECSLVLTPAA